MIDCAHRPPCPGCPRLGATDVAPAARDALDALAIEAGLPPPEVVVGARTGFRHRARLAVRGRAASPKIGIFESGTHRIVDIPRCLVHHPLVNEVQAELRRAMIAAGATPYSDDAHRGLVRYAQVVVERATTTAQVVVVTSDTAKEPADTLLAVLAERLGPRLHSLFWNGNPERKNTILGPKWAHVSGPEAAEERIGGARVFYPPGAFGQSNLDVADAIVGAVHGMIDPGASVLELFAGTGPIGLGLALRGNRVTFNEVAPESLRGLSLGIAALDDAARARTSVVPGDAARALDRADVVVVDPPRRGLGADLRGKLVAAPPAELVYVACGLASFVEDARALLEGGAFRLRHLAIYDLFPYTDHVEILARFLRAP